MEINITNSHLIGSVVGIITTLVLVYVILPRKNITFKKDGKLTSVFNRLGGYIGRSKKANKKTKKTK